MKTETTEPKLILASASRARGEVLRNAGLSFQTAPADIDEDAVKQAFEAKVDAGPADLAEELANRKAEHISKLHPGLLVIGADQVLEFEGRILSKPNDMAAARTQLMELKGKTHHLISAIALWQDGAPLWSYAEKTNMVMRDFTPGFLDAYLEEAGPRICESVGGYQLESRGIQLFARIEGDFFTILGLPLLPLLDKLRQHGILIS